MVAAISVISSGMQMITFLPDLVINTAQMVESRSSTIADETETTTWGSSFCSFVMPFPLQHGQIFAEAGAGGDVVIVRKFQLARDLFDDVIFLGSDVFIGGCDSEETVEERQFLFMGCNTFELPRHEVILRAAEQLVLGLGHLDDNDR